MSVITQSDEELEKAKEAIQTAITALSKIVIERISGSEDFSDEYQATLRTTLMILLEVREKLG